MRPKKLDIFILKSFLLLLAGTFFICLFTLLMNTLWRYIDIMVGKGLSVGVLAEFFLCSALTLVPMALPLAVLLAALITFGNFGERYELLSMKTAGISLLRVMRPLTVLCTILAFVSFYFQDVVGPNASKRMDTLAYSMYQKSPELDIPEGSFYDAITGYNLYVKHKDSKTGLLTGITIYDVSKGFENIRVIAADSGRMETTEDKRNLYLHLYEGEQFENMEQQQSGRSNNPYRRETFREKHLLIDFNSDFNMLDESLAGAQAASKNMARIRHDIDSLTHDQDSIAADNLFNFKRTAMASGIALTSSDSDRVAASPGMRIDIDSLYSHMNSNKRLDLMNFAQNRIQSQIGELSFRGASMASVDKTIRKHWVQWMRKLSLCLSVLIFFFIGAPLGAIIRKGGLGVPVIVSVCTFILYYMTSVSGEKMYTEGEWGVYGCWFSTIVLLPLSLFFTVSANKDSTVFEWDVYKEFFRHWFGGKVKRNIAFKDVVIDDPDMDMCISLNRSIMSGCSEICEAKWISLVPGYKAMFFDMEYNAGMNRISDDLEKLVEELSNTRDKVILDLLNGFPVMPVYGIDPPFTNKTVNRIIGIVAPVGLVFWVRSVLFSAQLFRQVTATAEISRQLNCFVETGKLE